MYGKNNIITTIEQLNKNKINKKIKFITVYRYVIINRNT